MEIAKEALRLASQKLPIKTKFIIRRDYEFKLNKMRKDNKTFIEMTTDELKKKLHDSRKSYSEIKLQHAVSQIEKSFTN